MRQYIARLLREINALLRARASGPDYGRFLSVRFSLGDYGLGD